MSRPLIALTTDFGTSDAFVGVMKGVILGINAEAAIVDVTHDVPPHDVQWAAFTLASAYRYFPEGTIHVVVVDPGVGTARRPLLVRTVQYTFVCPDNGLLSLVLPPGGPEDAQSNWQAFALDNPLYWLSPVSHTFHGRDIFAPVAAHLSRGVEPAQMGKPTRSIARLDLPQASPFRGGVDGEVIMIDRFGNLMTNLPGDAVQAPEGALSVEVAGHRAEGLSSSYQSKESLVALIGSHGYLEIAVPNGSAADLLKATVGTPVHIRFS